MTKTYLLRLSIIFSHFFAATPSAQCMFNNNTKSLVINVAKGTVIGTTASLAFIYGKKEFNNYKNKQNLKKLGNPQEESEPSDLINNHRYSSLIEIYKEKKRKDLIESNKTTEYFFKNSEDAQFSQKLSVWAALQKLGHKNPTSVPVKLINQKIMGDFTKKVRGFTTKEAIYIHKQQDPLIDDYTHHHEGKHRVDEHPQKQEDLTLFLLEKSDNPVFIEYTLKLQRQLFEEEADAAAVKILSNTKKGCRTINLLTKICNDQPGVIGDIHCKNIANEIKKLNSTK